MDNTFSFAEIARAMSAEGITCTHADQVGDALTQVTTAYDAVHEILFERHRPGEAVHILKFESYKSKKSKSNKSFSLAPSQSHMHSPAHARLSSLFHVTIHAFARQRIIYWFFLAKALRSKMEKNTDKIAI